jgi:hypothetical protein
MLETITALLLTPITLVCVLILGVILDHSDQRGWATTFMIGAFAIAYFMFDATLMTLLYGAGIWIAIGIIYSYLRWMWHCRNAVKSYSLERISKSTAMTRTDLSSHKGRITYWAFAWPVSLTATVLTSYPGQARHYTCCLVMPTTGYPLSHKPT